VAPAERNRERRPRLGRITPTRRSSASRRGGRSRAASHAPRHLGGPDGAENPRGTGRAHSIRAETAREAESATRHRAGEALASSTSRRPGDARRGGRRSSTGCPVVGPEGGDARIQDSASSYRQGSGSVADIAGGRRREAAQGGARSSGSSSRGGAAPQRAGVGRSARRSPHSRARRRETAPTVSGAIARSTAQPRAGGCSERKAIASSTGSYREARANLRVAIAEAAPNPPDRAAESDHRNDPPRPSPPPAAAFSRRPPLEAAAVRKPRPHAASRRRGRRGGRPQLHRGARSTQPAPSRGSRSIDHRRESRCASGSPKAARRRGRKAGRLRPGANQPEKPSPRRSARSR